MKRKITGFASQIIAPRSNMRKGGKGKNRRNKSSNGNNPNSLHPVINPLPYCSPVSTVVKARLSFVGPQVNSTGGGNILYSWAIDPTAAAEFSNYSSLYEEFRIIGGLVILCTYVPVVTSSSSVSNSLLFIAFDPINSYTPTAVTDIISYANRSQLQVVSLDRTPFYYGFKYPVAGPHTALLWYNSASAYTPNSCILLAADHVTASNTYFDFFVDLYLEFRSRA